MTLRTHTRRPPGPDRKQIQLLHVLPNQLGMTDDERRDFLATRSGGKTSSKDLTHREASMIIDLLYALVRGRPISTFRPDGATSGELRYAASLEAQLGAARFGGLAIHIGGSADLATLPAAKVRAIINAAKSIIAREGPATAKPQAEPGHGDEGTEGGPLPF